LPRRPDDIHLLARLRHPDSAQDWLEAWETLIREHSGRVYGLARRMLRHRQDAEDATQVVWERVLSALESFRAESALSTWLFRITMNVCLTRLDSRKHAPAEPPGEDDLLDSIADDAPDPERRALGRETRDAVERAIGELEPAFRAVILLREVEGLSYEEIARALDVPVNTVKTRLYRARLDLQQKLAAFRT
jgi:RNA polymerase sigma-70 factor (ECF subfamily)